jgi:hypothetical protein
VITGVRYGNAIRSQEDPVALKIRADAKTPFMHQRMMLRAQQHQVVQ